MKGLDKKPQRTELPLERRPFEEYSGDERINLAISIRKKRPNELSEEEKEYQKWQDSFGDDNDSQPQYKRS